MTSNPHDIPRRLPTCPSCDAKLSEESVLCVQCGYHLRLGRKLSLESGEPPPGVSDNPYESPPESASTVREVTKGLPEFDLTPGGIKEAEGVVSDANYVWVAGVIVVFCCQPLGPFLVPLYAYRLYQWRQLRNTFEELRYPNAFSPNGKLAGDFEEARVWLQIGLYIGIAFSVIWGLVGLVWLIVAAIMQQQLNNA